MARYEHFLSSVKGDYYPDVVIGLAVDVTAQTDLVDRNKITYELQTIGLSSWEREGSSYKWQGSLRLDSRESFWPSICRLVGMGRDAAIICTTASKVWPLVGIWELLEAGELILTDRDAHEIQGNVEVSEMRRLAETVDQTAEQSSLLPVVREMRRPSQYGRNRPAARGIGLAGMDQGSYLCIEDPPNIIACKRLGSAGRIRFLDLANYGIEYTADGLDSIRSSRVTGERLIEIIRLLQEKRLGTLQPTAASQAWFTYRRKYLKEPVLAHGHQSALDLEERSYSGGRCEAFRLGKVNGKAFIVDVRSMYPSICQSAGLPAGLVRYTRRSGIASRLASMDGGSTIADVHVRTDEPAYPVKRNGIVIYPVGSFRATLCGPELSDAIERNLINHVYSYATYNLSPILSSYANDLYKLRCECDTGGHSEQSAYIKRMLVGIVGKFGQRDRRWVNVPNYPSDKPYGYWYQEGSDGILERYRSIAWQTQREVVGQWAPDAVPAIASWITSLGRLKLLRYIRLVGWNEVHYCDTDALIVTETGWQNLCNARCVEDCSLGCLQLKEMTNDCEIRGIKHYRIGGRIVRAGLPRFAPVYNQKTGQYNYPIGASESIKSGNRPVAGSRIGSYGIINSYRHGIARADGRVEPFRLNEDI